MSKHQPIHVAVGAVMNTKSEVLIAQRPAEKFQGGLWEFPGGKVEINETVVQALIRELQEEVNLTPLSFKPLLKVEHDYGDCAFLLDVYLVSEFSGNMQALERQVVKWVSLQQIKQYPFLAANQVILDKLLTL